MIVVDTSAVFSAVAETPPNKGLVDRIHAAERLHAPHLIDVEFVHALRRFVSHGRMTADLADSKLHDFSEMAIIRYPHVRFRDRLWELRANLSAYDAAFVALAEALGIPLVTADRRLARSTGHSAVIELF